MASRTDTAAVVHPVPLPGRRRRRAWAVLSIAGAVACAGLTAPAASADARLVTDAEVSAAEHVGRGAAAVNAHLSDHDATALVADTLWSLGRTSGFAGQVVDEATRSVVVHWKGKVPARVRSYLASRPSGVTVEVVEGAAHSRTENMRAAQRLAESPAAAALGIRSVAVAVDGSGVVARVEGVQARRARTTDSDVRTASEAAGAPVSFVARSAPVRTATRSDDAPAWKGGARSIQAGGLCTTAFAVMRGTEGRLLSANHCDPGANAKVTDGRGQTIAPGGTSVAGKPSIDSQLIDPSASPATTARVYTGGWNSATTTTVKNWASNWVGQTVCTSGATSGQRCGKVTDDATTWPYAAGAFYVEASASAVQVMTSQGDSGGPVFAPTTGGVQARGVILGGYDSIACDTHAPDADGGDDPLICLDTVVYAPISVVLNTWGVKLEVA